LYIGSFSCLLLSSAANIRLASLFGLDVRAMRKNLNYDLTVATLVARNANDATVVHMVESTSGGCLNSGGYFYVGVFGICSFAVKMFHISVTLYEI
jgi:hypothetical protein